MAGGIGGVPLDSLEPRTKHCQPAMYIGGLAAFELLKQEMLLARDLTMISGEGDIR